MQINNHQIVDYDAVLDAKFGAEGTPERAEAEEKSVCFLHRANYRRRKEKRLRLLKQS